jgi:hypothetical protein
MLKQLQAQLPAVWTEESYSDDFQKSEAKDKNFRHALLHLMKAVGKLTEMPEIADHDGATTSSYVAGWAEKYLADVVICAVRMASTHPLGAIDLDRAIRERLQKKMGLTLPE